jgi:hypothetical protein
MSVKSIEVIRDIKCYENPIVRYRFDEHTLLIGYLHKNGIISAKSKEIECSKRKNTFYFIPDTNLVLSFIGMQPIIYNSTDANSHILAVFKNTNAIYQHINKLFEGSSELSINLKDTANERSIDQYVEDTHTVSKVESNLVVYEKKVESYLSKIWHNIFSSIGFVFVMLIGLILILTFREDIMRLSKKLIDIIIKLIRKKPDNPIVEPVEIYELYPFRDVLLNTN